LVFVRKAKPLVHTAISAIEYIDLGEDVTSVRERYISLNS